MMKRNASLLIILCAMVTLGASGAVVQRGSTKSGAGRATISRAPVAATTTQTTQTDTPVETIEPKIPEPVIIENKSSQFDISLDRTTSSNTDLAANNLAAQTRAHRAALDAADKLRIKPTGSDTNTNDDIHNSCDDALRACMMEKCGDDFTNCASDTDTMFGTKLDACRNKTKCKPNEFNAFSAEIKSDRAANIQLKAFNDTIKCGADYDACITEQCGTNYSKCLGKSAGDLAVSKCSTIAQNCIRVDNGLAGRIMTVFGALRNTAEEQISVDEAQLYSLRDEMKSICARVGAMFDERSLDCVYTVNFRIGGELYASRKAYAGETFDCTPNWFGVDVTTYMENANRLTRAQMSASGAMLGSGAGIATGALTSDAIGRAIDTQTAERDRDMADCEKREGYKWNKTLSKCVPDKTIENAESAAERKQKSAEKSAQRAADRVTSATSKKRSNKDILETTINAATGVQTVISGKGETPPSSGQTLTSILAKLGEIPAPIIVSNPEDVP